MVTARQDYRDCPTPIALVTGVSRGIGQVVAAKLTARGAFVIGCARSDASSIRCDGANNPLPEYHQVDVSDHSRTRALCEYIIAEHGRIDILVNNAAVYFEGPGPSSGSHFLALSWDMVERTISTNLIAQMNLVHATLPAMKANGYGRIVNVSSGMGRFVELDGYAVAYRTSKAAVNAFTRAVADTVRGSDILINAVCPGWTSTSMGGPEAPRSANEAADGVVWAATLPAGGITGALLRDGEHFGW